MADAGARSIPIQPVNKPILCNPTDHWVYDTETGAASRAGRRRPASYWYKTQRTGSQQRMLPAMAEEERDDLPLVNALREDIRRWRNTNYEGATPVTKQLLGQWIRTTAIATGSGKTVVMAMLVACKIYRGFGHHRDGCAQLLRRYSSGRSKRAFCLDFFQEDGMYRKLERLRQQFDSKLPLDQTEPSKDHSTKGAFLTIHVHFTNSNVEILHLGCNQYQS